jgi:hypothetical protein
MGTLPQCLAATHTLAGLPDEVFFHLAGYLAARDLSRLARAAGRFGASRMMPADLSTPAAAGPQLPRGAGPGGSRQSIVEEAARLRVTADPQHAAWVPRRGAEPWLALLRELEGLAWPPAFSRHAPAASLREGGAVLRHSGRGGVWEAAVCGGAPMRAGVHYAELSYFASARPTYPMLGVAAAGLDPGGVGALPNVRPGVASAVESLAESLSLADAFCRGDPARRAARGGSNAYLAGGADSSADVLENFQIKADTWMLHTWKGFVQHAGVAMHWEGCRGIMPGQNVGLLLDLDAGSLAVYLDGARLGLMVPSGLHGPLVWAVDICGCAMGTPPLWRTSTSVRIASPPGPVPATCM